jgi:hypothetical protein
MWFSKKKEAIKTEAKKNEPKVKQLSESDILRKRTSEEINRITGELEQLAPGQTLIYQLPELYWSGFTAFIIAELNQEYPKKGKKYLAFVDGIKDSKPAGNKRRYFESNNAKTYAEAVAERQGKRYI